MLLKTMSFSYLILFRAILLSSLIHFSVSSSQNPQEINRRLITQLEEAKLKVSQLESSLEEIDRNLEARSAYLEEKERTIVEMDNKINDLQSALSKIRGNRSPFDEKISWLEEEVRVLWATLRKTNFDIHLLESKAREAEERLRMLTKQVEKMEEIIAEQWIQIQQFEQALQLQIQRMRVLKAQRPRCAFLKAVKDLSGKYLPMDFGTLGSNSFGEGSVLRSYISQTQDHLIRFYSTVKEVHHQLQGLIKQVMERHEFTARFAHQELVFFVASALIVFPAFGGWMVLMSQLR